MSWRDRVAQSPTLADLKSWLVVELTQLSRPARTQFLRNQRAVAKTLTGVPIHEVAHELGMSPARISQLMERCLGGDLAEPPRLTTGLIPHRRDRPSTRIQPLPQITNSSGTRCAFAALLAQAPHVKDGLDEAIGAERQRKTYSQRLTPAHLHKLFLRLLAEVNWPQDRYPFTSSSLAYESVRRYLHRQRLELDHPPAPRRQRVVSEQPLPHHPHHLRALNTIQIDGHTLDLHTSIALELDHERTELRMSRCALLLTIDVATECVLGFHVCPTKHPTQTDFLSLLDTCLTPHAPRTPLNPNFKALPGPAFPVELSPAPYLSFETVQLDNAWVHHSHAVSDFLVRQMGATVTYGLPAQPKTRALVEHTFDYLERHLGHRVDSTTGSHPTDPARESKHNAQKAPDLTYQSLLDALYLVLGQHNQSAKPHLGGRAPLALFQEQIGRHWRPPPASANGPRWHPLWLSMKVRVHRSTHEARVPYVHCFYCRYKGAGLSALPSNQKHIVVHYNQRDIRWLTAQTLDGQSLGVLSAPATWLRFPHSLQTRRYLFRLKRDNQAQMADPLTDYFLHLARNRRTPTTAAELLRVYLEFSPSGEALLTLDEHHPGETATVDADQVPTHRQCAEAFVWSPLSWNNAGEHD